jgi:hypothetical protein
LAKKETIFVILEKKCERFTPEDGKIFFSIKSERSPRKVKKNLVKLPYLKSLDPKEHFTFEKKENFLLYSFT